MSYFSTVKESFDPDKNITIADRCAVPIPILIPARNEIDFIRNTLNRLSKEVEPIVLANACIDGTAKAARDFGATVIECVEEGKMPALQEGMRYLGNRSIEPFITLDADSGPVIGRLWHKEMMEGLNKIPNRPAVVIGPVLFRGGPGFVTNTWDNISRNFIQFKNKNKNYSGYFSGRNMLIYPKTPTVVDKLLALKNFWPGEDYAIKDVIVDNGGHTIKLSSIFAAVFSDASRNTKLWQRMKLHNNEIRERKRASYRRDAPAGAIRYFRSPP